MTTAARPTFDTARGGAQRGEGNLSALTKQYSAKDLPSHTKLKTRQFGQDTAEELRSRDFKHDLNERERSSRDKSKSKSSSDYSSSSSSSKRQRLEHHQHHAAIDADDPVDEDDDDSDDSDDDDDDTAELLAELQRIKRDRADEMIKKEQERRTEEERIRTENLLSGNPLLNNQQPQKDGDFKVSRRWDDDVVFKNCAKDDDKPKNSGFINDTIRSEFHKKFMDKYIK